MLGKRRLLLCRLPGRQRRMRLPAISLPARSPIQPSSHQTLNLRPGSDEQQATRRQGIAFFDHKGFPLGEYANLIKDRIYGQWFIPSNLRNSQGHTTVVFFIDKDGRYTDGASSHRQATISEFGSPERHYNSNPFPPLPQGFPGDHVGVRYIFSYNEPQ